MKRPHYRRRPGKKLLCERLEARQLFAIDLVENIADWSEPEVQTTSVTTEPMLFTTSVQSLSPVAVGTEVLRPWTAHDFVNYYRHTRGYGWQLPTHETITSQEQLLLHLQKQATQYWSELFGTLVSDQLTPWKDQLISAQPDNIEGRPAISSAQYLYASGLGTGIQLLDGLEVSADGYLYANRGYQIAVIDARDPTNLQTLSTIDVGKVWTPKMFVVGDRLITVGTIYQDYPQPGSMLVQQIYRFDTVAVPTRTQVQVFDISNKSQPNLLSTFHIDGSVTDSQLHDGKLFISQARNVLLPAPQTVGQGSEERFETAEEYLARVSDQLIAAYLPQYRQGTTVDTLGENSTLGDWRDIAWLPGQLTESTSLLQIDVAAAQPSILNNVLLPGISSYTFKIGSEAIYVPMNTDNSIVYRIRNSAEGQWKADGWVAIPGNIFGNKGLDEKDGILRVVSSTSYSVRGTQTKLAHITTIGEVDGVWQSLGTFSEFGENQEMVGVAFDGDRVLVTTGIQVEFTRDNILHIIDLSDPASPRAVGHLGLDGAVSHLLRLSETQWLGVGRLIDGEYQRLQLSLFDLTDPTSPKVRDSWTEKRGGAGESTLSWWDVSESKLTYDAKSGILSLGVTNNAFDTNSNLPMGTVLFAVDIDADDPLQLLQNIDHPEAIARDLVIGDYVVTVSANTVVSHAIDDLSGATVDRALLPFDRSQPLYVQYMVEHGESKEFFLLGRWTDEFFEIESIESSGSIKITATGKQQLKVDATQADKDFSGQQAIVHVRYGDGQAGTFHVSIAGRHYLNVVPPSDTTPPPVTVTAPSDATAAIVAHLENDEGETVEDPAIGDEVWIVVGVQDTRTSPLGVFGAYVNLEFLSDNMVVVGEPDHLREFVNARLGSVSASGVKSLGGFTSNLTPPGNSDVQQLARVKVRVTGEGPLAYKITPATGLGQEFLLFGVSARLAEASIENFDSTLTTRQRTLVESNPMDINEDGLVTPLDILLVINRLNAQADARARAAVTASAMESTDSPVTNTALIDYAPISAFDFDVDGLFSDDDIYFMIDAFNARISTR